MAGVSPDVWGSLLKYHSESSGQGSELCSGGTNFLRSGLQIYFPQPFTFSCFRGVWSVTAQICLQYEPKATQAITCRLSLQSHIQFLRVRDYSSVIGALIFASSVWCENRFYSTPSYFVRAPSFYVCHLLTLSTLTANICFEWGWFLSSLYWFDWFSSPFSSRTYVIFLVVWQYRRSCFIQ